MYSDNKNNKNLKKLSEELQDVKDIMKKNIKDLFNRGDKLSELGNLSDKVLEGTKSFKKGATYLNQMHYWRIYGPVMVILLIVFIVLYLRWKYY